MRRSLRCGIVPTLFLLIACGDENPLGAEHCAKWSVDGVVTNATDGSPVEEVSIDAEQDLGWCDLDFCYDRYKTVASTETDSDGYYALTIRVCSGPRACTLRASKPGGYCSMNSPVTTVSDGAVQRINIQMREEYCLDPAPTS